MTTLHQPLTETELLAALRTLNRSGLRGGGRAPHKPLLLLWLVDRFAASGNSETRYEEVAEPVGRLIAQYTAAVSTPDGERAALPFRLLETELWAATDAFSQPLPEQASHRRLLDLGARGRLRPAVEELLGDRRVRDRVRTLLLAEAIGSDTGTGTGSNTGTSADTSAGSSSTLEQSVRDALPPAEHRYRQETRRVRDSRFARAVLPLYGNACAVCGFSGRIGPAPVGVEAAHVHGHADGGPDVVQNGIALCALHHALFDQGVLGLTEHLTIMVSPHFTHTGDHRGPAVTALAGLPVRLPADPGHRLAPQYVAWHTEHVFRH
ncbi:phosphorothioated DNA-binding restriction endonuclease [Kitasatospora cineracea]|uniref:Restriction endonuclease n=1 Tax=Kitasatospora cineracea TaxID=88074 RepID=A0A3N4RY46_9ACTN|nr:HNH endonuclease [Kitasatospora cineracea]RPE33397.1 putative restriction endonuclease [Kitasatospora cineracea]